MIPRSEVSVVTNKVQKHTTDFQVTGLGFGSTFRLSLASVHLPVVNDEARWKNNLQPHSVIRGL